MSKRAQPRSLVESRPAPLRARLARVVPGLRFAVSDRIEEAFGNGREYYALHGRPVREPRDLMRRPDRQALTWHNENRYLG